MPGKIKTIMTISDVHDKECDRFTVSLFIETCRLKQPDIIVLNGDIFDLYEFSKFSKDPRHYDILGRFQFIWDNLFRPLRENCPNAQIDFLMGNHEFRLIRLLADATPNVRVVLSDILGLKFSDIFKVDEFQINWVSKADFSAFSKTDVDNEIKKNYRVYYGAYVVSHIPDRALKSLSGTHGHHHTTMLETDAVVDAVSGNSRFVSWVQTPGAHVRDAEYLDSMSKWNTGFLEAVINIETGEVIQKVHQTFGWCVIDGVYYERSNFEEV
jgi:predicted phosphodiesterase